MTMNTSVFLGSDATFEASTISGEPAITIYPDGRYQGGVVLYLGNGLGDPTGDQMTRQLDGLLDAISAAISLWRDHNIEPAAAGPGFDPMDGHYVAEEAEREGAAGPDDDDDDDEPTPAELAMAREGSTTRYHVEPSAFPRGAWQVVDCRTDDAIVTDLTLPAAVALVGELAQADRAELSGEQWVPEINTASRNTADRAAEPAPLPWPAQVRERDRQAAGIAAVRYDQAHPMTEAEARATWGDR